MAWWKQIRLVLIGAVIALLAVVFWPKAETGLTYGAVGRIEQFEPMAEICLNRDGGCQTLQGPFEFFMGNFLRTDGTGAMLAVLSDATTMQIGANADIVIDEYIFDPEKVSSLSARVISGAVRMKSGEISKQADSEVALETPVASIGVRGTDFWVGEIDGAISVLLFDGAVVIETDAGQAVLDQPGQGVAIPSRTAPPGEVKVWPEAKVTRALAMVPNF